MNRKDMTIDEKRAVRKFRKQYNLSSVESGGLGYERKSGQRVNSPWLNYARDLKFVTGKRIQEFKKFQTQANYLKDLIPTLTNPADVNFFQKELDAVKFTQNRLMS